MGGFSGSAYGLVIIYSYLMPAFSLTLIYFALRPRGSLAAYRINLGLVLIFLLSLAAFEQPLYNLSDWPVQFALAAILVSLLLVLRKKNRRVGR